MRIPENVAVLETLSRERQLLSPPQYHFMIASPNRLDAVYFLLQK
jgi:hypothetical protein